MRYYILGCILFISLSLNGQAIFTTVTDAKKIYDDSFINVSYELRNANAENYKPPSFTDFRVIGGPSQSQSTSVSNGRRTSKLSISYRLEPKRTGILTIGGASVTVNGKRISSNAVKIEVLKKKKSAKDSKYPDYYVKMEVLDTTAYVGQQVNLLYKVYHKPDVNVHSADIKRESSFDGFYAQALNFNPTRNREIIDGQEYIVFIDRAIALFPQTAGEFTIDAGRYAIFFPDNRRQGFFFNSFKEEAYTTNSAKISVKNIPINAPEDFIGGIGKNYEIKYNIKNKKISTDDASTLILEVVGDGDNKKILPPTFDFGDNIEVYDANLLHEDQQVKGTTLTHRNQFEYLLVPKKAGRYMIEPKISYFNTDSAEYVQIKAVKSMLTVIQGSGKSILNDQKLIADQREKMTALATTGNLRSKSGPFIYSMAYWGICFVLVAGLLWILYLKKRQMDLDALDPEELKRSRATKVAIQKLEQAQNFKTNGQSRQFYDEVSKAMLTYISDKLEIPPSDISKNNVSSKLNDLQIDQESSTQFVDILKTCEMSLFAGQAQMEKMEEVYKNSISVLSSIENQLTVD